MTRALDPAELTPDQRRAEIAEILARGVLRALKDPPEKDLEVLPESSAHADQRAESS
ncbi:hypothetical protein [Haloferula sp. A504]|uniref:hypothetical protein n=1 Tax=Haloferula sp. A504 TaxID=3373601 RepID=UPI0031C7C011|nr:hypothetical protein [Verrucomicrobiaceae bacterium E54]